MKTLADVMELVIARLEAPSPHTTRSYRDGIRRFSAMTGLRTVTDLQKTTPKHLQACLDRIRDAKSYRPATVRHAFMLGRVVARYLVREGLLEASPFRELERIRVGRNVPEWNVLGPGELERVLAAVPKRSVTRVIFTWLAGMGLRAGELLGLRLANLSKERGRWVIAFTGKGGKKVRMAVKPEARAALEAWWEESGYTPTLPTHPLLADENGNALAYIWLYRTVCRTTKRVLGHRVTPHGLRATYVTRLVKEKGLYAAQKMARHASDTTTRRYIRGDEVLDEEEL